MCYNKNNVYFNLYQNISLFMEYAVNLPELDNPALVRGLLEEAKVSGLCIAETPDSIIFKVPYDNTEVIVRLSTPDHLRDDERTSREGVGMRIEALEIGHGLAHFEQIVAYSLEDEVVVTEIAEGTLTSMLNPIDLQQITRKQFKDIFDAILIARDRNIVLDYGPNNFFYHPERGFTIIDYMKDEDVFTVEQSLVDFLQGIAGSVPLDISPELRNAWIYAFEKGLEEIEDRIELSDVSLINLVGAKQWLQQGA